MNLFKAKSQSGPVLTAVAGVFRKLNSVQNAIPLHDPKLKRNSHFYHQNNQNKEKESCFYSRSHLELSMIGMSGKIRKIN